MRAHLGLPGGQLVANPIPAEAEIPAADDGPAIDAALAAAAPPASPPRTSPPSCSPASAGTGGAAVAANIALVVNNARLAARIAIELAALPA